MARVRVHNLSVSVDGYAAGPDQSPQDPLGVGGEELHEWLFAGSDDVSRRLVAERDAGIGASIMGRNMFGPVRGPWDESDDWRGWWGEDPPFHHPVFVLTHHAHAPIPMAGGTTFHFVTDGIEAALERATAAADGRDVRIDGGSSTVQQYLRAGLVDELHVAVAPTLLGGGERLFDGLGDALDGFEVTQLAGSPAAAHFRLVRSPR